MTITPDQYTNNATSTVNGSLTASSATIPLPTGDGAKFPATGPFMVQLGDPNGVNELCKCTSRSGDTLNVVRGSNLPAPDTCASQTWTFGTAVQLVVTAGNMANIWNYLQNPVVAPANLIGSGAVPSGWTVPWAQVSGRPFFNVFDYGAKGDGSTDDSGAFQAAINAATAAGAGRIFAPRATYNFKSGVIVNCDNIEIVGEGFGTVFKVDSTWASANPLIWYQQPAGTFRRGCVLSEFSINGQNVAALTTVIRLDGVRHCDVNHIEIHNCPASNAQVYMYGNQNGGSYGAYNTIRACTFRDSYTGVGIYFNNSEWCTVEACQFILFNQTGSIAIHNLGGLNCNIVGNQFDAVDTAVYLDFCNYTNVVGNQFDEGNTQFIRLKACKSCTVEGNTFNSYTNTVAGASCIFVDIFGNNERNVIANNAANLGSKNSGPNWGYFYTEGNTGSGNGGMGNVIVGNTTNGLPMQLKTGVARDNLGFNPLAPVPTPAVPSLSSSATGGTVPDGTYQALITYVNAFGETLGSATASITTAGGGLSKITITPPNYFGSTFYGYGNAYGYYVYITQAGGSTFYRQQAAGSPTPLGQQYKISANPTTTGATPPGSNTTAGFAQPAVPSPSGTSYTNAFGVDCTVHITGGTVSAIAIGGLTTGMTSGVFTVLAGQTIALTYSVAPTWVWQGN